jgi:acyl carrier protein
MRGHEGVKDAVVMLRKALNGDKHLVAYVIPEKAPVPTRELRQFLEKQLPAYMIPQIFIAIDTIPLSPNGKLDRKALPDPIVISPDTAREPVPPRTPVEEKLAGIWRDVLKLERVDVHDSFFELGGSSLLAMQVLSRIRMMFGIELRLPALFESPTIEGLAKAIAEAKITQAEPNDVERLLEELEQLPDEAARRMLDEFPS